MSRKEPFYMPRVNKRIEKLLREKMAHEYRAGTLSSYIEEVLEKFAVGRIREVLADPPTPYTTTPPPPGQTSRKSDRKRKKNILPKA